MEDVCNKKEADIGTLRAHYLMVAKLRLRTAAVKHDRGETRRAPFYFTSRLKVPEIQKLFTNDLKQRIDSIKTFELSTLSWESIKEVYRASTVLLARRPKDVAHGSPMPPTIL